MEDNWPWHMLVVQTPCNLRLYYCKLILHMQFNLQFNLRDFADQCGQLRVFTCHALWHQVLTWSVTKQLVTCDELGFLFGMISHNSTCSVFVVLGLWIDEWDFKHAVSLHQSQLLLYSACICKNLYSWEFTPYYKCSGCTVHVVLSLHLNLEYDLVCCRPEV